jgi:hypothetical protein
MATAQTTTKNSVRLLRHLDHFGFVPRHGQRGDRIEPVTRPASRVRTIDCRARCFMHCPGGLDLFEQPLTVGRDIRPRTLARTRTLDPVDPALAVLILCEPHRLAVFVPLIGKEFTVAVLVSPYCTAGSAVEPPVSPSAGSTEVEGDCKFFCWVPESPEAISHAA